MKKLMIKKYFMGFMAAVMTFSSLTVAVHADEEKDAVILYTNDVHCAIDEYSKLAAYEAKLIEEGHEVVIVDVGDAIQGEIIGSYTNGSAIINLMDEVGYDYAIPGNHEFDYGVDVLTDLSDESDFTYLSANFIDLQTKNTVFQPYEIVEMNGEKIAFVGICTPESYTKSTPAYFQDENGNLLYDFSQQNFYQTIQDAVDSALADGAQRVIALGHLGIAGTTEGWTSVDVVENTTGIDVFLDAHAHEVIEEMTCINKTGEDVIISSTGSKFANFGQLTLTDNGEETTLIQPGSVDVTVSEAVSAAYTRVQGMIDEYNTEMEFLFDKIGTAEVPLTITDSNGNWINRIQETNMSDFITDAYKELSGAEIAIVNAGCIRAGIPAGDVSRKALMDVNPWNNEMCVIKTTGKQIFQALEFGARLQPQANAGLVLTSGLSYELHNYIESPVVVDELGNFVKIEDGKDTRVKNVKVNGVPLDMDKEYTVASNYYMLKEGGDGFTMFTSDEVLKNKELLLDSQMLIEYFTNTLDGVITKEQYGKLYGEGRVTVVAEKEETPTVPETPNDNANPDKPSDGTESEPVRTGDVSNIMLWIMLSALSMGVMGIYYKQMKE